mgnify:FL=1
MNNGADGAGYQGPSDHFSTTPFYGNYAGYGSNMLGQGPPQDGFSHHILGGPVAPEADEDNYHDLECSAAIIGDHEASADDMHHQ